jgi:hypothetical protein
MQNDWFNTSLKTRFFLTLLFIKKLGDLSDKHGEVFRHDISTMKKGHRICRLTTAGILKRKDPGVYKRILR